MHCTLMYVYISYIHMYSISLFSQTWQGLWGRGKIKIFGDDDLQKTINACFYHILSSLPAKKTNSFYGLSPGMVTRLNIAN